MAAAHIGVWIVLVLAIYSAEDKRMTFTPHFFEADSAYETELAPGLVRGADGAIRCKDNPLYCEPFSFVREVRFWAGDPDALMP